MFSLAKNDDGDVIHTPTRRAGFEKGWHCLTAGVRRLHLDVLDVMILVVYPESFVYNVIA